MLFRFLITIGSMLGFVTGGLDLLERFGVPVNQWLSGLPDIISGLFFRFGLFVDETAVAVFGAPDAEMSVRSQSVENGDIDGVAAASPMMTGSPDQALWISGAFTLVMLFILLVAMRRTGR
ncbi:hypothetical protein [Hyphobacterium sp.]|uniref:hypothetical protein n=1 Tax=Hyphobacterium sp. TaxID=2004662 RepID=UPI0037478E8A